MPDDTVRVNCVRDECGTFLMDAALNRRYKKTGSTFYCPAGHGQHYTGDSTKSKLRERIGTLESRIKKLNNRIKRLNDEVTHWYEKSRDEKKLRKDVEKRILDETDGVVEVSEGRWRWACSCGNKTTTAFDTEREAWAHYDQHRERMHAEGATADA